MARDTAYPRTLISILFKTSKYSDARTKIKSWKNKNIDEILDMEEIPGIPKNGIILEIGVGDKFPMLWKKKYKL